MAKQIAFLVSEQAVVRSGLLSDADLWDYNEIAQELSHKGDVEGAFDWIHYNIALTEDIYGVSGDELSILVYDISNVDRNHTKFDDDPNLYLSKHPELLVKKYFDFHVIEVR